MGAWVPGGHLTLGLWGCLGIRVWKTEPLGLELSVWLPPPPPPHPTREVEVVGTCSLELEAKMCPRLHKSLFAWRWLYLREDRGWEPRAGKGRGLGGKEEGWGVGKGTDGSEVVRLFLALIPQLTPPRSSEYPGGGWLRRRRAAESWLPKDRDFLQGPQEAVNDPGDHTHRCWGSLTAQRSGRGEAGVGSEDLGSSAFGASSTPRSPGRWSSCTGWCCPLQETAGPALGREASLNPARVPHFLPKLQALLRSPEAPGPCYPFPFLLTAGGSTES